MNKDNHSGLIGYIIIGVMLACLLGLLAVGIDIYTGKL